MANSVVKMEQTRIVHPTSEEPFHLNGRHLPEELAHHFIERIYLEDPQLINQTGQVHRVHDDHHQIHVRAQGESVNELVISTH